MRYFLELSYDGTGLHGWQRQPNADSVQQRIEDALSRVFREAVQIVGAGRTDSGVHARRMYAHFDVPAEISNPESLLKGLNKMAGPKIALHRIIPVAPDAHARFDATERIYKYFVIFEKSPFLNQSSWLCPGRLNVEDMNEAASLLIGKHDFTSFSKLHTDVKTNLCDITHACWGPFNNIYGIPGIVFTIKADRFLRNMVRAIVGTLVDVGRGKISIEGFREIIRAKDRCAAGTSMPPQALFLWDVKYDYIEP